MVWPSQKSILRAILLRVIQRDILIQGSNKRKAKKENTKPNSQKALGSLTSTVLDEGAQSAIHTSQPESSNVSLVDHRIIAARILFTQRSP